MHVYWKYKEQQRISRYFRLHAVQSHCIDEVNYLNMGKSNYPDSDPRIRYIKMKGRKVYEYAMKHVPEAMKMP